MKNLPYVRRLTSIVLVAVAMVLAAAASSQARESAGHGFSNGQAGGFEAHRGFEGHRGFGRGGHGRAFIGIGPLFSWGPAYPYWWDSPAYAYPPSVQSYWYYCPSAGAYYPYVPSCPEAWVPVPATAQ